MVTVPAKPMTWAALAGRNATVAGSSSAVTSAANAGFTGRTQPPTAPVISSAGRTPVPDHNQPSKTPASYAPYFCLFNTHFCASTTVLWVTGGIALSTCFCHSLHFLRDSIVPKMQYDLSCTESVIKFHPPNPLHYSSLTLLWWLK